MPSTAGCAAVSAANAAAIGAADLQDNSSGDPQHPLSTVAGTRGPVGESAGVKECGFDCRAAVGVDQAKEEGQDRSAEQAGQDAVLREKSTTANATAAATTTTEVIAASAPAHGEGDGSQATTFAADAVAPDTGAATAAVAAASDDVPLGAEQMAISLLLPTEAAAGLAEKLGSGSERTGIVGVDEAEENRTEYQGRRLLQLAEGALARLYETHDNYFCSDRDEKKVRVPDGACIRTVSNPQRRIFVIGFAIVTAIDDVIVFLKMLEGGFDSLVHIPAGLCPVVTSIYISWCRRQSGTVSIGSAT